MTETSPSEHHKQSPLDSFHRDRGARMVTFAGFDLPLHFDGVISEHHATRTLAGLFDVSHMGIIDLIANDGHGLSATAEVLEKITPAAISDLRNERLRYGLLTNNEGGIIDDLIVSRHDDRFRLVLNASRTSADISYIERTISPKVRIELREDLAQLALQGPKSSEVLSQIFSDIDELKFMQRHEFLWNGIVCDISRSGYTGEDGFELVVPAGIAGRIAEQLLDDDRVFPCGLGARDTLRLEAGLCLYGHELNESTTPVEAGLAWTIQQRRRNEASFAGADTILGQLASGPERKRVGVSALTKRPIREGTKLRSEDDDQVGTITSGGYGPTCNRPVAMGYVDTRYARVGTSLVADVRGKDVPCEVTKLPFVPHNYRRD